MVGGWAVDEIGKKVLVAPGVGLYSQELLSLGCTHPAKLHWPGLAGHPPVDTENSSQRHHTSLGNLSLWLPYVYTTRSS